MSSRTVTWTSSGREQKPRSVYCPFLNEGAEVPIAGSQAGSRAMALSHRLPGTMTSHKHGFCAISSKALAFEYLLEYLQAVGLSNHRRGTVILNVKKYSSKPHSRFTQVSSINQIFTSSTSNIRPNTQCHFVNFKYSICFIFMHPSKCLAKNGGNAFMFSFWCTNQTDTSKFWWVEINFSKRIHTYTLIP